MCHLGPTPCHDLHEMNLICLFLREAMFHGRPPHTQIMWIERNIYVPNPSPIKKKQGLRGQLYCAIHMVQRR